MMFEHLSLLLLLSKIKLDCKLPLSTPTENVFFFPVNKCPSVRCTQIDCTIYIIYFHSFRFSNENNLYKRNENVKKKNYKI